MPYQKKSSGRDAELTARIEKDLFKFEERGGNLRKFSSQIWQNILRDYTSTEFTKIIIT